MVVIYHISLIVIFINKTVFKEEGTLTNVSPPPQQQQHQQQQQATSAKTITPSTTTTTKVLKQDSWEEKQLTCPFLLGMHFHQR